MSILILEQHSERVPVGDVPSHPTLLGTCFTFISFSISTFSFGYLETCPPTRRYVGTCYFINNQHHGYGSTVQNPCHRSPFARPHTVRFTIGHNNYRVSLSSGLFCHGYGSSTNPHFIEVHLLGLKRLFHEIVTYSDTTDPDLGGRPSRYRRLK